MTDLVTEESIALQEKQELVQAKYLLVPIDQVEENTWNPNKMDEVDFQKLKANLENTGGNKNGPINVRPHPDKTKKGMYQIIDGAHRYRAMKELGFEEIVVTVDDLDDAKAMLGTIGFNKFRGTFDNVLLAGLIHDLKTTYNLTDEEIKEALGYTEDEIKGLEALVDFDFSKYEEDNKINIKEEKVIINDTFTIHLEPGQITQLETLLAKTKIKDKSKAAMMCIKYWADQFDKGECKKEDIDTIVSRIDSLNSTGGAIITDDEKADSLIPVEKDLF